MGSDGQAINGANNSILEFGPVTLADDGRSFRCVISNPEGQVTSASAILSVTNNQRPNLQFDTPLAGATYRAGETISFSGSAIDPEDGNLDASQFTWWVDFHHADHTHPALAPVSGITAGELAVPIVGETSSDVFFRVYMSATDSEGLSRTIFTDVLPELVSNQFDYF